MPLHVNISLRASSRAQGLGFCWGGGGGGGRRERNESLIAATSPLKKFMENADWWRFNLVIYIHTYSFI